MNPFVFHAQGIRGAYPDSLDAAFLHEFGLCLAAYRGGTFVVGNTGAVASAHVLAPAGAVQGGARVIDVGEVSRPQFAWAMRSLQANTGVLCGSDGLQAFVRHGNAVEVLGGDRLRQLFDANRVMPAVGTYEQYDIAADYAAAVGYAAGWQGGQELRLAIDAPAPVRRVLERFGPIAPDPAIGARFDAEGNMTLHLHGAPVPADHVALLLAEGLPVQAGGRESSVCVGPCFSRTVRERLEVADINYHAQQDACDHASFPELTLLRVWQACNGDAAQLEQMLAPYQRHMRGEISVPVRDRKHAGQIFGVLAGHFAAHSPHHADCLTVDAWDAEDFWLHAHMAHADPVLHVALEAKEKDLLEHKLAEVRALIG